MKLKKEFYKKKKKAFLYTEEKKKDLHWLFCALFRSSQWVTIVFDFEKWHVDLECWLKMCILPEIFFVLLMLTLAIQPSEIS